MARVVGILAYLLSFGALGADLTITWQAPLVYEDGSPLPLAEIKNYRFQYTVDGVRQTDLIVSNVLTSLTVTNVVKGTHCFVGFTVSIEGIGSLASTEQPCKTVSKGRPKPPRSVQ